MKHIFFACKVVAFLLLLVTMVLGPALLAAYIAGLNGYHFSMQMFGICMVFGVFIAVAFISYFMEKYP